MSRKEPTREMKINRIYTMLDDMAGAEELEEEYIDDLLSIVQQYHQLIEERKKWMAE